MYRFASAVSFAIRVIICYFTIETTPIFASSLVARGVDQIISLYTVLWAISYIIVGRVIGYKRGSEPVIGVILYAAVYIPLALLTWLVLALLTLVGVLPF